MAKWKKTILTEKDSQVQALCKALDIPYGGRFKPAFSEEKSIALVPLSGHVLTGLMPSEYKDQNYSGWEEDNIYVFPPKMLLKPSREDILDTAVSILKDSEEIILATDFDNEGAALAMNVIEYAGVEDKVSFMMEMGSTHPEALKKSFNTVTNIPFKNMAASGKSRGFIDWAEGMSLSRALSYYLGNKHAVKISFGGVLTPLIYMIVSRQIAFEKHEVSYYWIITGVASFEGKEFKISVKNFKTEMDKKGVEKQVWSEKFDSEAEALELIEKIKDKELSVKKITRKEISTQPPRLYELSELQQDMSSKFKVKPDKAMEMAQKNYDFPVSIQAYPRTDTPYLKEVEYNDVPIILKKLKEEDVIDKSIIDNILSKDIIKRVVTFKPDGSIAKDGTFSDKLVVAHGGIVPTIDGEYKSWLNKLDKLNKEMFYLISKRYVSNFMEDYKYISISAETEVVEDKYKVLFSEKVPKQAGWKAIYEKDIESKIEEYQEQIPETLKNGSLIKINVLNSQKKETKPKPLFTMKTLLAGMKNVSSLFPDNEEIKKYLGENGIGTNATRSSIIAKVMDSDKNNGEAPIYEDAKGNIKATEKAKKIVSFMPSKLISPIKRAMLSKDLKEVELGNMTEEEILNKYREQVKENIELIKKIYEEKGPIASPAPRFEELGECPICKEGQLIEKKKVYHCSKAKFVKTEDGGIKNEGCTYMIRKHSLERFGKNNISKTEVKKLLKDKEVQVSLKSKKTGAAYNASMVIDDKWGVSIDFSKKKD